MTLSKVVGDLQRSGIKRSRIESPGDGHLKFLSLKFPQVNSQERENPGVVLGPIDDWISGVKREENVGNS